MFNSLKYVCGVVVEMNGVLGLPWLTGSWRNHQMSPSNP